MSLLGHPGRGPGDHQVLVLVDCDGTLYRDHATSTTLHRAVIAAAETVGMTEERCDDLYFTYGSTLAGLVATGVLSQPESIDAFHKQAHDPHVVTAPSFDEDTLAAVKRLVTTATNVAVVTAAPEFHGIRCVDALRLRHLLPRVIGSSQLQHLPKTDPATWVRAAEL
jgi:phosphoserine phosphatase